MGRPCRSTVPAAVRLAVLSAILLPGCAAVPPGAFDRVIAGRTVEGRLSVRYKDLQTNREEALSGRFVWTTSGEDLELSLLDPLGQTVALIRSGESRSSITFRDGRQVDGATPEALTQRTLGWTVPLRGLRYWLDGRADPASASRFDAADGRLYQNDWKITFTPPGGASVAAPGDSPPKRIDLFFPGPPAEIEMRLVVDERSGP